MKRSTWLPILGALLIVGVYLVVFRKSDEGRIRAQLAALAGAVHLQAGESELFRAKRIQDTFARVFPTAVQLDLPDVREGLVPRSELFAIAAGAGQKVGSLDLRFESVRVELEKPERKAWVTSAATASGDLREGGQYREPREVVMRFEESEGEWRITSVAMAGASAR